MSHTQVHELTLKSMVAIATGMLLLVMAGFAMKPQADEGAAAHIFQLLGLAGLLCLGAFLATANWHNRAEELRRLWVPAGLVALAFAALYYLEHVYYLRH